MRSEARRSHNNVFDVYLREISRIPRLLPAELAHLLRELKRLRELDDPAWQAVKDRVVLHHLRLVIACARRMGYGPVPLPDLIQEGNLGLMRAAELFDADRGSSFSSYAGWWIERNILLTLERQRQTIRLPSDAWALDRRVRRLEREGSLRCGENPSTEEIAEELQVSPDRIDRLRELTRGSSSYHHPTGAGTTALGDTLVDPNAPRPDAAVDESWLRRAFARGLANIDERARRVLTVRWGLGGRVPMTLGQTGEHFGISGARVCQIEKAAFERLRRSPVLRQLAGFHRATSESQTPELRAGSSLGGSLNSC